MRTTGVFFLLLVLSVVTSTSLPQTSQSLNNVSPISAASLLLKIQHNAVTIGQATGFVVEKNNKFFLLTNRHVVLHCAQDQTSDNVGGWNCANKLSIFHNRRSHLGEWIWVEENLFDQNNQRRWVEHPTLRGAADLVALPLTNLENVQFYPLDLELRNADVVVSPGDPVTIVGFPFGLAEHGGLAVWKTGTVASDMVVNFQGKPVFLVDTTSRPGMSGSPVYAVRSGAYRSAEGNLRMATNGSMVRFLGIYSEQYLSAEVGGVWKADAVKMLYDSLQ